MRLTTSARRLIVFLFAITLALIVPIKVSATSASATFIGTNTTTQGSWKGVYGADGWNVIGDTGSTNNPSYPSYATVSASGNTLYT